MEVKIYCKNVEVQAEFASVRPRCYSQLFVAIHIQQIPPEVCNLASVRVFLNSLGWCHQDDSSSVRRIPGSRNKDGGLEKI